MKLGGIVALSAALVLSGCAHTPPPVSDKVAQYYSNPPEPTLNQVQPLKVTPLADIQGLVSGDAPLTVSVLGDSTGNDAGEWVELWAQHLGATNSVTVHRWTQGAATWPVTTYGEGKRVVNIWNGSEPGSNGMFARERFHAMQPVKPDLVIYNYGHNDSPSGAASDVEALQRMAEARWGAGLPFVVTLQNASRGKYQRVSAKSVSEQKAWAVQRGVPVIDIESTISEQNLDELLFDEVHPNQQGSRFWADKVAEALG